MVSGEGLTKTYKRNAEQVHALRSVELTLYPGELVALVGPSGSGKSTLLNVLCGWERADAGALFWGGELAGRRAEDLTWSELALIPQALGLLDDLTVGENVALPARLTRRRGVLADEATALMASVGIAHLVDRYPKQASSVSSSGAASPGPCCSIRGSCWPTSPPRTRTRTGPR
ncbi:MAG: ATP-binding cassette domain-containing protein [Geodermatophilaceae bacterium]